MGQNREDRTIQQHYVLCSLFDVGLPDCFEGLASQGLCTLIHSQMYYVYAFTA
jgi:hypothetical protein